MTHLATPPDSNWMDRALQLAQAAAAVGEVPVGALVLDAAGSVVGEGANRREQDADPTAHAEVVALRQAAAKAGSWHLDGSTLVTTLEPCLMCAGAALAARIDRVVFGAWDDKAGACGSVWDVLRDRSATHRVEVLGGVQAERSNALLVHFFARQRQTDATMRP